MSVDFYPAVKNGRTIEMVEGFDWDDSINVSNASAFMLLRLIGIEAEELVGTLSISQVRQIAELVDNPSLIKGNKESRGEQGARIIECGYSIDRLRGYASRFEWLANEAEKLEAQFVSYA